MCMSSPSPPASEPPAPPVPPPEQPAEAPELNTPLQGSQSVGTSPFVKRRDFVPTPNLPPLGGTGLSIPSGS